MGVLDEYPNGSLLWVGAGLFLIAILLLASATRAGALGAGLGSVRAALVIAGTVPLVAAFSGPVFGLVPATPVPDMVGLIVLALVAVTGIGATVASAERPSRARAGPRVLALAALGLTGALLALAAIGLAGATGDRRLTAGERLARMPIAAELRYFDLHDEVTAHDTTVRLLRCAEDSVDAGCDIVVSGSRGLLGLGPRKVNRYRGIVVGEIPHAILVAERGRYGRPLWTDGMAFERVTSRPTSVRARDLEGDCQAPRELLAAATIGALLAGLALWLARGLRRRAGALRRMREVSIDGSGRARIDDALVPTAPSLPEGTALVASDASPTVGYRDEPRVHALGGDHASLAEPLERRALALDLLGLAAVFTGLAPLLVTLADGSTF